MAYFVQLEMVNHCFSGGCKFDGATWFDFRVSRMLPYVASGPPVTDEATPEASRLCAVTDDATKIAAGCPQAVAVTSTTAPHRARRRVDHLDIVHVDPTTCDVTSTTVPVCVVTGRRRSFDAELAR